MKTVIAGNRAILLDVQGSNVWSGQEVHKNYPISSSSRSLTIRLAQVQSYNSDAITWGALAKPLYAPGSRYGVSNSVFIM